MRAPGAAADADVLLAALLEAGADLVGRAGGARRVLEACTSLQAELRGGGGEGAGELRDRLLARGHQRRGGGGQPGVPDVEIGRRAVAGDEPREQRVALRQRLAVALAQLGPRRPAGGGEAVEVGAALGSAGP